MNKYLSILQMYQQLKILRWFFFLITVEGIVSKYKTYLSSIFSIDLQRKSCHDIKTSTNT